MTDVERLRILKEAAKLLEKSESIRDPGVRVMLFDELDRMLGSSGQIREVPRLRPQVLALVRTCIEQTGGLRMLADCLDLFESNSGQVQALLRLADEWQVIELLAGHNLQRLRADLTTVRITGDLGDFVAGHRPEPVPDHCESAWHLFAHLAGTTPAGGRPVWLRFLDHVAVTANPGMRRRIRDFVAELAEEWDSPEPAPAATPATTLVRMAYLVFQFEKYGADDDTFIMSHWYQWASPVWQPERGLDRHVPRGELEKAVDEVVLETERRWAHLQGPVTIEFVLPGQLLNEPVDRWQWELDSSRPRRLAIRYPLVIRSLERMRADQWHRVWRGRWQTLADPTIQQGQIHRAIPDQADVQLEAALEQDAPAVVLVLSEPPLPDTTGESQLLAGLRSGMPAIVWDRNSGSQEELCEVVESMIDGEPDATRAVARLPQSVAELRRKAWHEYPDEVEGRLGHGLVILWDDPDRQPGRDTGEVRA
jgi:hypothetical protein